MNGYVLGNLLALLVSLAGWFYLFYSHGVRKLSAVEGEMNRRRILLRRLGGLLMLLCAGCIYGGNNLANLRWALACWLLVLFLLLGILALAWLDLRLTMKLKNRNQS